MESSVTSEVIQPIEAVNKTIAAFESGNERARTARSKSSARPEAEAATDASDQIAKVASETADDAGSQDLPRFQTVAGPSDADVAPPPAEIAGATAQVAVASDPSPAAPKPRRGRPPKARTAPVLPAKVTDEQAVEDCVRMLVNLDGRDLRTDIERGAVLIKLQTSCSDKKTFGAVLKGRASMTTRHANNLMGVSEAFGAEVDRWAALGVTATHLRHLVGKPTDYIDQCHAEFTANGVPKTAVFEKKVRADFSTEEETSEEERRMERQAFIAAAARRSAERNLNALMKKVEELHKLLLDALTQGPNGKPKYRKPDLFKKVALPARTACRHWECCLAYIAPQKSFNGIQYFDRVTVEVAELQALRVILMQLGSIEAWPMGSGTEWIETTALPMVEWALGIQSKIEPPVDAIIEYAAVSFRLDGSSRVTSRTPSAKRSGSVKRRSRRLPLRSVILGRLGRHLKPDPCPREAGRMAGFASDPQHGRHEETYRAVLRGFQTENLSRPPEGEGHPDRVDGRDGHLPRPHVHADGCQGSSIGRPGRRSGHRLPPGAPPATDRERYRSSLRGDDRGGGAAPQRSRSGCSRP